MGPLLQLVVDRKLVLIVNDRHSKMLRAFPMSNKGASHKVKLFMPNKTFSSRIPAQELTDHSAPLYLSPSNYYALF